MSSRAMLKHHVNNQTDDFSSVLPQNVSTKRFVRIRITAVLTKKKTRWWTEDSLA